MNLARTKPTRDSIFQIIGTLVKKFNHGLACSLKLMQVSPEMGELEKRVSICMLSGFYSEDCWVYRNLNL